LCAERSGLGGKVDKLTAKVRGLLGSNPDLVLFLCGSYGGDRGYRAGQ